MSGQLNSHQSEEILIDYGENEVFFSYFNKLFYAEELHI